MKKIITALTFLGSISSFASIDCKIKAESLGQGLLTSITNFEVGNFEENSKIVKVDRNVHVQPLLTGKKYEVYVIDVEAEGILEQPLDGPYVSRTFHAKYDNNTCELLSLVDESSSEKLSQLQHDLD